jgi:hypothetical protein
VVVVVVVVVVKSVFGSGCGFVRAAAMIDLETGIG